MQAHRAKPFEKAAISATLAAAFADDPLVAHVIPKDMPSRKARLKAFMSVPPKFALAHGALLTTDQAEAAAAWQAPGAKPSPVDMASVLPRMMRAVGSQLRTSLTVLRAMEAEHPKEPHWYLETLGTRPDAQGKGAGRACLEPILSICDRDGFPAYLESSKLDNVPYYEKSGFEVTKELPLPGGGPTMYLMWRSPH